MRMIPDYVSDRTKSAAERRLFPLLAASVLPSPAWGFHSLNISEHDYKLCGELDFVVLCPRGLLVLEVKGGGVACEDGVWIYTDRFGHHHRKAESPFEQAKSGLFSLRSRLQAELPEHNLHRLPIGYAVLFPDCQFDVRSVEWSQEVVLDKRSLTGATHLSRQLDALYGNWSERTHGSSKPSADLLHKLAELLRPNFQRVPSLQHRAEELEAHMDMLTDEQYAQYDIIEDNPRVLCSGGAGTGKTFLAAETARRHASGGEEVLLTCHSPLLASFLTSRLPGEHISVRPFGELLDDCGTEAWADVLIVDEAQDVLNLDALECFDRVLKGGLEKGTWRLFYDQNNQSALLGDFDSEALELLKSFGGVTGHLRRNCRNTEDIVLQTRLLTAADLGNPSAGPGPPVEILFYADKAEQLGLLEAYLSQLADDQDVLLSDVTLLSAQPFGESCASSLSRRWSRRLTVLDAQQARDWPPEQMTFATIEAFKGLENRHIALIDLDVVSEEPRVLSMLYVGMSRARATLWLCVQKDYQTALDDMARRNFSAVFKEGAREG